MNRDVEKTVENFVERMGLLAQGEGLSRTAGRLLGLLVIEGGPMSFGELADRLDVSRGSISTNTRLLVNLGVIERTTKAGSRQDHFQIRPQPYLHLLEGHLQRLRSGRELIDETRKNLPADWTGAHTRLEELNRFHEFLAERTEAFIARNLGAETETDDR